MAFCVFFVIGLLKYFCQVLIVFFLLLSCIVLDMYYKYFLPIFALSYFGLDHFSEKF